VSIRSASHAAVKADVVAALAKERLNDELEYIAEREDPIKRAKLRYKNSNRFMKFLYDMGIVIDNDLTFKEEMNLYNAQDFRDHALDIISICEHAKDGVVMLTTKDAAFIGLKN